MIIERTVIVEYLDPSMCRELLCKFPDNSAFDFDYSKSSIWSPLAPRHFGSIYDSSMDLQRNLSYGFEKSAHEKLKKVTRTIKKKITTTMTKRKKISDFSATPVKSSSPRKGWNKILKVASKQFKKKKTDPIAHVKLSNFLRD